VHNKLKEKREKLSFIPDQEPGKEKREREREKSSSQIKEKIIKG